MCFISFVQIKVHGVSLVIRYIISRPLKTTQCLKLISRTFRHFDTLSQFLIEVTEILDRSDNAEKSLVDIADAAIKVEKKLLTVFKKDK